ncbi:hypothetical protein HPB51_021094 [Rhipicephalus microplus]|uniref:Uncharacterized protein n=1 Tax=Rhipicephalus microplus TaxID=6941 RepID=A0A9J6EIH6_RHIMP|nr:hypothetical protein HPB51_021094 [Rhipicephalus microplus]
MTFVGRAAKIRFPFSPGSVKNSARLNVGRVHPTEISCRGLFFPARVVLSSAAHCSRPRLRASRPTAASVVRADQRRPPAAYVGQSATVVGKLFLPRPPRFPPNVSGGGRLQKARSMRVQSSPRAAGGFYCVSLLGPCDDFRFRLAPEPFPPIPSVLAEFVCGSYVLLTPIRSPKLLWNHRCLLNRPRNYIAIDFMRSRSRWIVRNKAAEKAKHHHVSSNGGSPQPQSSPTSVITHAPASAHESSVSAAAAAAALQRPSYSINGILGIPSAEAAKRKRDDQVSQGERLQSTSSPRRGAHAALASAVTQKFKFERLRV